MEFKACSWGEGSAWPAELGTTQIVPGGCGPADGGTPLTTIHAGLTADWAAGRNVTIIVPAAVSRITVQEMSSDGWQR